MTQVTCVLCHDFQGPVQSRTDGDGTGFNCPRCGVFTVSNTLSTELQSGRYSAETLGRVRMATKNSPSPLKILSHTIKDIAANVYIPDSVTERIDNILLEMVKRTTHLGEFVPLDVIQYAGFKFFTSDEFNFARGFLTETGLLQVGPNGYRVTVKGHERVRELTEGKGEGNKVFVAMSFDEEDYPIFKDGISPACKDAGYEAERVDGGHHLNRIDDSIVAGIRNSAFVVADFTKNKRGCYYEAGFAHALGRPVILTCKAEEVDPKNLHFDINHFPFIKWESHEDLRKQLSERLLGRIGKFNPAAK